MLVINAKKFLLITSSVLIAIVGTIIILQNPQGATVETSSVPVTNKVIVIDSGHRW